MIAFIAFGCIGLALFTIIWLWALAINSLPDDDEEY